MKKCFIVLIYTISFVSIGFSQFGNALKFDGVSDYIEIEDHSSFDQTANFTIELWIHVRQLSGTQVLIRKGNCNGYQNAYYVAIADGKVRVLWDENGNCGDVPSYYETDDIVVSPGECVHISVVHSTDEIKVYINAIEVGGTLVSGSYGAAINSNQTLTLAAYIDIDGTEKLFFGGQMDEVRIWNYRLSEAEIVTYASSPLGGDEDGLVAYYDMEGDANVGTAINLENKAVFASIPVGTTHGSPTGPFFELSNCDDNSEIINDPALLTFRIYPNPANLFCTIQSEEIPEKIEVYSLSGQLIFSTFQTNQIDLSKIAPGVYCVKLTFAATASTVNLVVE